MVVLPPKSNEDEHHEENYGEHLEGKVFFCYCPQCTESHLSFSNLLPKSGPHFFWTISFSKHSKLVRHKVCVKAKNRTMAVRGMWKSAHTPQCLISRSEIYTNLKQNFICSLLYFCSKYWNFSQHAIFFE